MARATAANDADFQIRPLPVRVLHLHAGAQRVRRKGEAGKPDELWLGSAWDPNDPGAADQGVYLRIGRLRPTTAEVVCAVVGRAIALPVPEPFLVRIERGTLPGSRLLDPAAATCLAFASLSVGGHTFAQLLRADSDAALEMLLSWQHLVPVATFDEWMANPDRNLGNILFVANSLWLIDHAEALGGVQADLYPLAELTNAAVGNRLAHMMQSCAADWRLSALERARTWLAHPASALDLGTALACTGMQPWHSAADWKRLLDFVQQRLALTHTLLCARLGLPQLPLNPRPASR